MLSSELGALYGPINPISVSRATVGLAGRSTTNPQIPLDRDVTVEGRTFRAGETLDTALALAMAPNSAAFFARSDVDLDQIPQSQRSRASATNSGPMKRQCSRSRNRELIAFLLFLATSRRRYRRPPLSTARKVIAGFLEVASPRGGKANRDAAPS